MNELGNKIARKRKDLGLTQTEFANRLSVTRQSVSRWEAGTVLPDIDKIGDIADILGVSCDYLLKDTIREETDTVYRRGVSRLLGATRGKRVKLDFFEDEEEPELMNRICKVIDFEGNWMKVCPENGKTAAHKLIPVSTVRSVEIIGED